jgi:hypothetical protein
MEGRIEHVRQPCTEVAGQEASEHLEGEMLRGLLLGLSEGVAPSGDGSDGAMCSAV